MKTDDLSPARVLGEMKKAMAGDAPDVFFDVLRQAGALEPWFGELAALIDEVLADTGASTKKDMGRVMGELTRRTGGNFDKAAAAKELQSRLA